MSSLIAQNFPFGHPEGRLVQAGVALGDVCIGKKCAQLYNGVEIISCLQPDDL